jgi:hypothetical protein
MGVMYTSAKELSGNEREGTKPENRRYRGVKAANIRRESERERALFTKFF